MQGPGSGSGAAAPRPTVPAGRDERPLQGRHAPRLYTPTAARPLRAKRSTLAAETRVQPHRHAWAQLAWSATGVMRLTAGAATVLVPPSRAVWIPPGVEHAVTVVETAELRTLYLHQPPGHCGPVAAVARADGAAGPGPDEAGCSTLGDGADAGLTGPAGGAGGASAGPGTGASLAAHARVPARGPAASPDPDAAWRHCRVLEVSDLLRALLLALDPRPDDEPAPDAATLAREALIAPLLVAELAAAAPLPLGLALPSDKRLRSLCEAVLDAPQRHATLAGWVRDIGASERTVARLFRQELGTSFGQWRQQALLARALTLAARGRPMGEIATALGYASPSAFSAMVRRSLGTPPSRFFAGV